MRTPQHGSRAIKVIVDRRTQESLNRLRGRLDSSFAECIRRSVSLMMALCEEADPAQVDLVLRHRTTREERRIIIRGFV